MTPSATVSANIPEEGKILGRAGAGISKSFRSSSSQAAVRRLKSCVRAALLKSVAWTLPAVRFKGAAIHGSQADGVRRLSHGFDSLE